jgi:opacity protein-like surface antigen
VCRSKNWLVAGMMSLLVVGFAVPSAAQDDARAEVAGGWNYIAARSNADNNWEHFYKGGFGEIAVNLNNRWGVVGNVAYNQKTITDVGGDIKINVIPYLFGIRLSAGNAEKVTPFAHFLAGATSLKASQGSDSVDETPFTWQVGGGLNIAGSGRVGARVGADYLRIRGTDDGELTGGEAIQGLRISAGVVVGF